MLINTKLGLPSTRSYTDKLTVNFRSRIKQRISADKTRRYEERKAEMTQEELIHDREYNTTHQRASKTRRALRFVCTATGELEAVQEQFHRHQPTPMEEICRFSQAAR